MFETHLRSIHHNKHYLDRYITFIRKCQSQSLTIDEYTEEHHICPKSMFPHFIKLKKFPWNGINLTARQHFLAHIMLWKAYGNREMTLTVYFMKNVGNHKINSRLYERFKKKRSVYIGQYSGTANKNKVPVIDTDGTVYKITKEEFETGNFKAQHSGTVMVTDGNIVFRVSCDDPRFASGELVGHTKGKTFAVDKDGNRFYVSKTDPRFNTNELKGNNAGTITINNGKINQRIAPTDPIPKGWYLGMFKKTTPKGSFWITNGIETKMIHGSIPEGWKKGRSISH